VAKCYLPARNAPLKGCMGLLFEGIVAAVTIGKISLRRRPIPCTRERDIYEVNWHEFLMSSNVYGRRDRLADSRSGAVSGEAGGRGLGGLDWVTRSRGVRTQRRQRGLLIVRTIWVRVRWHQQGKGCR